jgi:hypothetical protein
VERVWGKAPTSKKSRRTAVIFWQPGRIVATVALLAISDTHEVMRFFRGAACYYAFLLLRLYGAALRRRYCKKGRARLLANLARSGDDFTGIGSTFWVV